MSMDDDRFNLSRKVFVGNISYRVTQKRLQKFFSKFGEVEYCYIVKDHIKKWSRGIAFVTFVHKEAVEKALQASEEDLNIDDRIMRVKRAEESKRVTYVEGWQHPTEETPDLQKMTDTTHKTESSSDITEKLSHLQVTDNTSAARINTLCDDTLGYIMAHLPILDHLAMEKVCHRWRDVAMQSWSYQTTLQFKNMFRRFEGLTDKLLSTLLHRCGVYLRFIDLSTSPRLLTDMSLDIIGENCPSLQKIDLSGVAATDISLRNLGQKCTKLKWACLQRCFYVGDKGLSWFLQNCVDLEYLDVEGNARIQGDLFHKVGSSLRTVILSECSKLKDYGVSKLCSRCKNLQELQMSNCLSITDKCIQKLTQECQDLKILHLAGNTPQVTADGLACIRKLTNLTELNLSRNVNVDDEVITAIADGCLYLQKLDVSGCYKGVSDVGIKQLVRCPVLTDLDISYLYKVTDETLEILSSNGKLEHVTARACSDISDTGVKALCMFCNNLELIDLSGCNRITMSTLNTVLQLVCDSESHFVLCLGGTNVEEEDLPEFSNDFIKINMHDLSMRHLKGDRDLILPSPEEYEEEDEEGHSEVTGSYGGMAAGAEIEIDDEWEMYEDQFYDDFLDADDPLAMERWQMS